MKLKLRRDEETNSAPASDQLEVGELVINSVTGKLYTKLVNGNVVEFDSRQVCFAAIPNISFDDITNFCCYGDTLNVRVRELEPEPKDYSFEILELTSNQSTITLPQVINYTTYTGIVSGGTQPTELRQTVIPINVAISGNAPISILKFSVLSDNELIAERTISLSCKNCANL